MPSLTGGRSVFREWVDNQVDPRWPVMPLTHISNGIIAEDIIRCDEIDVKLCQVFSEYLAYFFYGRPAYRLNGDSSVKFEAACPYCFIFNSVLVAEAKTIFAFDTGAFHARLYKKYMMPDMNVEDFSLEKDSTRPNRIISSVFSSMRAYFDGDITQVVDKNEVSEPWDFHVRAYLDLISSSGRNDPDDRICSIEVIFDKKIPLCGNIKAVIVPHTLWNSIREKKAPWLIRLCAIPLKCGFERNQRVGLHVA
jgi:hypothetical protein